MHLNIRAAIHTHENIQVPSSMTVYFNGEQMMSDAEGYDRIEFMWTEVRSSK